MLGRKATFWEPWWEEGRGGEGTGGRKEGRESMEGRVGRRGGEKEAGNECNGQRRKDNKFRIKGRKKASNEYKRKKETESRSNTEVDKRMKKKRR